jgi:hypothetical protein
MFIKFITALLLITGAATIDAAAQTPETVTDKVDSHADKTSTQATVYLYRAVTKERPTKNKISLYADGEQLASVPSGRYVMILLDPGKHSFNTQSGGERALELELKRGEKYYLLLPEETDSSPGGPRISAVEFERGAAEVRQSTPVEAADVKGKVKSTVVTPSPE